MVPLKNIQPSQSHFENTSTLNYNESDSKIFDIQIGNENDWLNTSEAAKYLKISKQSLLNRVSFGKVIYYKFGRSNRYRKSDLERLLLKTKRGVYL